MTQIPFQSRVFTNVCKGIDHLYSDGQFCDLVVTIGSDNFSCHRLVLAAVSDFFQSSLTSSWHESSTGFVNIDHEDVTGKSFHLLLDILYKGTDSVTMETVTDILRMSIYLRIKFLEEYCEQYLCDNMAPTSCLGAWQFAEKYQLVDLADKAAKMAATRFNEVAKSDELLHLPKAMLLTLLSLQKKLSMDDLCKTIFKWAEEEMDKRKCHLGELLHFVNFTQLTPQYVCELMRYMDHPFRKYILDYVNEGMTYTLKGVNGNDVKIQKQIRARQNVIVNVSGFRKCAVIVGGCTEKDKPLQDVSTIPLEVPCSFKVYRLKSMPELCGLDFATCVWKNELYVSSGSLNGTHFSVYKPGEDEWESLPALPQGRMKHTMAALDWNIFVLGGLTHGEAPDKTLVKDILVYRNKNKSWNKFSSLLTTVTDATATALGHRIYVFGGQDIEGKTTDIVQCVNTLTGCVYLAGHLPSPTSGAKALSNGGTVFVIRSEGEVLQMKENFALADRMENNLDAQKSDAITQEHFDSPSSPGYTVEATDTKSNNKVSNLTENGFDSKSQTVQFKVVGSFPSRRHFGCYLHEDDVVVCGGVSDDGDMLYDMVTVNLTTAASTKSSVELINGSAYFGLHLLNLPQEYLTEDRATAQPIRVGSKVKLSPTGINSFYLNQYGQQYHIYGGYMSSYNGPPQNSVGIVEAIIANGSFTVNFPGYGNATLAANYIQLNA